MPVSTPGIGDLDAGVIEYLSGFTTGSSTSQVIDNVAWGDSFIIDGAPVSPATPATLSGTTLTVKNGATTVFTMNNVTSSVNAECDLRSARRRRVTPPSAPRHDDPHAGWRDAGGTARPAGR